MAWGQIAGAFIGGMAAKSAAKTDAAAQRYANDMSNRPYTDARPYINDMYEGGTAAFNDALAKGAYTGETYAGMDPTAREGYNYMSNFGRGAMPGAAGFMNQGGGFGTNYQDIYNRASGPTLDNAVNYATQSPQASSLIDAAMRDSTRQLNEQTLPGIDMAASASGNTRNSRAGVAEGIAQRAYDDRRADVASSVYSDLTNQYLRSNSQDINNMMSSNSGLKNTYGIGFGMGPRIGNMLTGSGAAFQTDRQGQLDAAQSAFLRDRDYAMDAYNNYGSSILNQAPRTSNYAAVTANPYTAQLGGAMAGFGIGGKFADLFQQQPTGTTNPTTGYYQSYNPTPSVGVSSYY